MRSQLKETGDAHRAITDLSIKPVECLLTQREACVIWF